MKKIHPILFAIAFLAIIASAVALYVTNPMYLAKEQLDEKKQQFSPTVVVGNNTFRVTIAKTESERAKGLMYISSLAPDQGMLFVFERAAPQTFWNKNTKLSLRIIWIHNNIVIGTSDLPSDDVGVRLVSSVGVITHALELPLSSALAQQIKIGDSVRINE